MDLLETVLRSCDADKFTKNFKDNGIDYHVLKILTEEDLQALGVQDEALRSKILSHFKNLQIPGEKPRDLTVNGQFLSLVLMQMNVQLIKHYANLLHASRRPKVDLCYIRLGKSLECLEGCVDDLDKRVEALEKLDVLKTKASRRKRRIVVFGGAAVTSVLTMFVLSRYFKVMSHLIGFKSCFCK